MSSISVKLIITILHIIVIQLNWNPTMTSYLHTFSKTPQGEMRKWDPYLTALRLKASSGDCELSLIVCRNNNEAET